MSTDDQVVDIELENDKKDPDQAPDNVAPEKEKVIEPDDGINDLKMKLQDEQKRRFEAENRAREAVLRQYQAQTETEEANYTLVKSAIKTLRSDNEQMKAAYIDYSMSVIVSRALPDVRDGLKPVHRRVLFGMNEMGVRSSSSYKKSARIVGDEIGRAHV